MADEQHGLLLRRLCRIMVICLSSNNAMVYLKCSGAGLRLLQILSAKSHRLGSQQEIPIPRPPRGNSVLWDGRRGMFLGHRMKGPPKKGKGPLNNLGAGIGEKSIAVGE